jgi:hypothetical protein
VASVKDPYGRILVFFVLTHKIAIQMLNMQKCCGVECEIFIAVTMKTIVFCDVKPYSRSNVFPPS